MARGDHVHFDGEIADVRGGGLYKVRCATGHEVLARVAGRMRRRRIRVVLGDHVTVAVAPCDLVRGLIIRRER